jgi:2-dehydro-3-deoxygluconokinase
VGAGHAFVAGYLNEVVAGRSVPDCLHTGNACGAAVSQVPGDWEGLPRRGELAEQCGADEVGR